jgi:hypothetical protein
MSYASRKIVIYRDNRNQPGGWGTRCTEFDEHGQSIVGRTAMDIPLEARTAQEARQEAAEVWGCPVGDIKQLGT